VINQNATSTKKRGNKKKEQRERYVPEQMISFFPFSILDQPSTVEAIQYSSKRKEKKEKSNST